MTTGSDVVDNRITVTLGTGVQKVGTYWSRVWQGGDAVIPKRPLVVYLTLADGTKLYRRAPRRIAKEEHNYKMDLVSSNNPAGSYRNPLRPSDPPVTSSAEGQMGGVAGFVSKWTTNDELALLGKLRDQVQGSSFNAAVFLAEGNQALHMILSAASALDGAYRHAKRGNFAAASKSIARYERKQGRGSKTLASNWLEYQYGVKPLLSDVFDAAVTLAKLTNFPMQQTVTVTRKVPGTIKAASPGLVKANGEGFDAMKIKAIIREVNIPSLIGLQDPASVVWEKLPYSFVVDWFLPIGSYLSARGLSQSLTGTFVTTRTTKWKVTNLTSVLNTYQMTDMDRWRHREVHMTRTVSTTLFVPYPSVKPLAKAASWAHAANAVALLTQKIR